MEKYYDINSNGCSVRCKLFADDPRAVKQVIICCHGFGGDKDSAALTRFAEHALAKYRGTAVVGFDWPCHGEDGRKKLCLDDCVSYLQLVIDDSRERFGTDELYAHGVSFGAYNLLNFLDLKGNPFRKIVLRCPAVTMYDSMCTIVVPPEELEKLRKGRDALAGFARKIKISPDFLAELQERDVRRMSFMDFADDILIIHGTKDEVVPFEEVKQFAENNVIEFIAAENADHRFMDPKIMDRAISDVLKFMFA